jgi:hypothetical protein
VTGLNLHDIILEVNTELTKIAIWFGVNRMAVIVPDSKSRNVPEVVLVRR